jgi:UDP-N-acetylmuramate dehydrogenase
MELIKENVSLKTLNTFGIDVNAKLFSSFQSIQELKHLIKINNTPNQGGKEILILGGGSNMLFTKNPEQWIWQNCIKGIEIVKDLPEELHLRVGAGENWHSFVLYCVNNNWGGIENLSLIPGCVGAGPMQNIGAYGVELKDSCTAVECVELKTGNSIVFNSEECEFGYRESIFKNKVKDKYVITFVYFRLSKNPKVNTQYGSIKEELEAMKISQPTIKDVSNAVIKIRQSKLPNPLELGNAGSFFKNPVISKDIFENIKLKFPDVISYPSSNGNIKLAAGWLIENCGLKGYREKNVGVHSKQALVLVNYGDSQGSEIWDLSEKVIQTVYQKYHVMLEREVNIY